MNGGPPRSTLARLLAAAALACAVFAVVVPASAQETDEIDRPDIFRGTAEALVGSGQVDREALLPVPNLFKFIVLDGQSTYEAPAQTARASLIFPGEGLIQGAQLACGQFGGSFPEQFKPLLDLCLQYKFPLSVFADSLDNEDSSTGSSELGSTDDPINAASGNAEVLATLEHTFSEATISRFNVGGIPPFGPVKPPAVPGFPELDATLLRIGSATSDTDQQILEDGSLRVEAVSRLSGVKLIGGLIGIESILSKSVVTDDADGGKAQEAVLEIEGVTVGGVPAKLTEDGLEIDSTSSGPLEQQLVTALNGLIGDFGIEMQTLEADKGVDSAGIGFANVGGVFIEFGLPVDGAPVVPGANLDPNGTYVGTIQLGVTGATGIAAAIPDVDFAPAPFAPNIDTPDVDLGPVAPDTGFTDPGTSFDTGGSDLASPPPSVDGGAPTPQATEPEGATFGLVPIVDKLFADRLGLVYLAFTLSFLAFCVSPRLTLPSRLPGGRS